MAVATTDRNFRLRAGGYARTIVGKTAAATKIYRGAMVAKNAAGFCVPAADAVGLKVLGIAEEQIDNLSGAAGDKEVRITTGVVDIPNAAVDPVVQASMHGYVFVTDDSSVRAGTGTNSIRAGVLELIEPDRVWILIGPEVSNA